MNIRLAKVEDAPDLIEFNQAMALETEGKRLETRILQSGVEAVFNDEKKGFYVVAEEENKIIGGLMITF
ncbi:MAG: GNAT family N-acetyltransferase, partial [Acidobacteriota bacterium]